MAQSNHLQKTQNIYNAFKQGNMEPLFQSIAENVLWTNHSGSESPFTGAYFGPDGVKQYLGHMEQVNLEKFDIKTMMEHEGIIVVLIDVRRILLADSTIKDGQFVHILRFENDKIVKMDIYEPRMI